MADILKQTRKEIDARLRELKPLIEEYAQLERVANALDEVDGAPKAGRPAASAKPRKRSSAGSNGGRRGRPKGSGKRAQEVVAIVTKKPGATIPEIAKEMKIQPNYLYRVLPSLAEEGKVQKKDKGWHPAS